MSYFKLKPEVYLITGKKKSTLHNLVDEKLLWIDNRLAEGIRKAERGEAITELDFEMLKSFFAKYNWGVFSDKPVFMDKFRSINIYNEKKMHKNTPFIETATLQLTNECNLDCEFCGKLFCPSCRIIDEREAALSLEDWMLVVDKLKGFGVKTILLTGGEVATSPYFKRLAEYVITNGISLSVHTNGMVKNNDLPEDSHLIVSVFQRNQIENIIKKYKKKKLVSIILYDLESKAKPKSIPESWQVVFSRTSPIPITNKSMVNVDFDSFFSRKLGDHCLDKKLLVTYDGSIYPCMELKCKVGSFRDNGFHLAIQKLVSEYWKKGVDSYNNKCTSCEFRYACSSCSFFDTENCHYDLEEGKWISSLTN